MAKIIGKIVAVQGARDGVSANGAEWHQRQYVVEDETHPGEGVIVTTYSKSVMMQVGHQTNGQLTVEVEYVPRIRYWNGERRDGSRGVAQWNQSLELTGFRILRGTPANQEGEAQTQQAQPVQVAQPQQAQPAPQAYVAPAQPMPSAPAMPQVDDLPF